MSKTYNRLEIDVNDKIYDIITGVQDDSFSRYLDVTLYSNNVAIDLTGHNVRIFGVKPDGKEFYNEGQITDATNGRVQFELTNQILAVCGIIKVQIIIYKAEKEILSTQIFNIFVTESLRSDNAIESSNEYGALVVFFQNLYEAYNLLVKLIETIGEPGATANRLNLDTMFEVWEYLINQNTKLENKIEVVKNEINNNIQMTAGIDNYLDLPNLNYISTSKEPTDRNTYSSLINLGASGYLCGCVILAPLEASGIISLKITVDNQVKLWLTLDSWQIPTNITEITRYQICALTNAQNTRYDRELDTYEYYYGSDVDEFVMDIAGHYIGATVQNHRNSEFRKVIQWSSSEQKLYSHQNPSYSQGKYYHSTVIQKMINSKGIRYERNLKIEYKFNPASSAKPNSKKMSVYCLYSLDD